LEYPIEFRNMPKLRPPDMLSKTNPEHLWLVEEDWKSPVMSNGKRICVRGAKRLNWDVVGFWTDGVSVPQLMWSFIGITPFSMPEFAWALPHDLLYASELMPREECDEMLYVWSEAVGNSWLKRASVYRAVRNFGGFVWSKHTKESIEAARQVVQLVNANENPIWPEISCGMKYRIA
jgi:hypothetical protein